ncbi:MAG: tetratricopeptide repeat protein, partial [Pseudobdellovibrio sp.]
AMNNKNRAPSSIGVPESFDEDVATIDPMHNQAQADFLFLKSEMESNSGRNTETIELLKNALIYDPQAATVMQRLAVEYYKNAKMSEALSWAEKARSISPNKREINLLVAGLYTTTKNYTKAEELYKKLIKKDSDDTEALLYLGAVYTEQKNYPKAIEVFRKLTRHPSYDSKHVAHYYIARIFSEQNKVKLSQIKAELSKAIEIKPDFFDAVSMLGHLTEKLEGKDKAYQYFADYQRKHGPNLKVAELLSQYYITNNQLDKAFEQLEIIDESNEDQIQVKLKMALILIEKKIYDKAVVKLEEILKVAPESDKVRFYLSAVLEEKRDFKAAFEQYMLIPKASSYFEDARLHAAYISKVIGNSDQAMTVLKESLDKKVENPQSYFLMSQLWEDKKDVKNAIEILKTAESKFPKNSQVYYQIGTLQDRMNLKEDMLINMKKVVELDPEHAQALNFLAYTWAEKNEQLELAETYARKAAKNSKGDAFILDTLGWVLYKKGEFKEAIQVLEKAHNLQPEVSIISEHLGDVYFRMNLHEKAVGSFIKAVETEGDKERKAQIQNKLVEAGNKVKNSRVPSSVDFDVDTNVSP